MKEETTNTSDIIRRYLPQKTRRSPLMKFSVAGLGFHEPDSFWDELDIGTPLALVRELKNPHDVNAVALAFVSDYDGDYKNFDFRFIIGYVPKAKNEHLATLLDMGWQDILECEITHLDRNLPLNERLQVTVYVKNKEDISDHLLRATLLSQDSYRSVTGQFRHQGFAKFRWGGFPLEKQNLPQTDENLLFVYPQEDNAILYLTRVIALGEKSLPFLEDIVKEDM